MKNTFLPLPNGGKKFHRIKIQPGKLFENTGHL